MKYAIVVPFNYKKINFDTIKSITKPFIYYQLDLLINKIGFDKVFIIHNHENISDIVKEDFDNKYEFVHPLDFEYSKDNEELYYLKSLAIAISKVPDSAKELYIIGDNILIDPIVNFELMTYNGNNRFISFIKDSTLQRGMHNIKFTSFTFDNSVNVSSDTNTKVNLLPAFIMKGSLIEFLKLKFSDNYGSGLLDNISDLSKNKDFRAYSIASDDFRECRTFDDFTKFKFELEMEN